MLQGLSLFGLQVANGDGAGAGAGALD